MTEVKIEVGKIGRGAKIVVAGQEIQGDVSGFHLSGTARDFTRLTLDLTPDITRVEANAVVTLGEGTAVMLRAAGWIPPYGWATSFEFSWSAADEQSPVIQCPASGCSTEVDIKSLTFREAYGVALKHLADKHPELLP